MRRKSYELDEVFKDYNRIFTDGSSDGEKVSAAAVSNKQTKTVRHWMEPAYILLNCLLSPWHLDLSDKKLSCRRESARRFVSMNILLSY